MSEYTKTENRDEVEIDLSQLWKLIKKNIRLLVVSVLVGAILSLVYTVLFIDKQYASEARIYLTPKVSKQGVVDNATVNSNSILVNNYVSMLKGENVLSKVAEKLDLTSAKEVKSSLTISNEKDTQIISVVAKTTNPIKSKQIVETTVNIFFTSMKDNLDIRNMTIIDSPKIDDMVVSPSNKKNLLLGGIVGGFLSCGYVFLAFLVDKRLRNREEAENFLGISVLAEIPYYEE